MATSYLTEYSVFVDEGGELRLTKRLGRVVHDLVSESTSSHEKRGKTWYDWQPCGQEDLVPIAALLSGKCGEHTF